MNKCILMVFWALSLNTSLGFAQSVGSAFSYQGELTDGGSPANGDYNFTVKLYTTETGGTAVTDEVYNGIAVQNGLFNLEIDFGDMVYEDNEQYYLEFDVAPSSGGSTTTLAPRNKLLAVPYAVQAQFTNQNSDGLLKYMIFAQCDAFPTIEREFNATDVVGSASIVNNSQGVCDIELPFDTADSYVVVSATNPINLVNRTANCIAASNFIRCKFEESSTGNNVDDAFFTLLVY